MRKLSCARVRFWEDVLIRSTTEMGAKRKGCLWQKCPGAGLLKPRDQGCTSPGFASNFVEIEIPVPLPATSCEYQRSLAAGAPRPWLGQSAVLQVTNQDPFKSYVEGAGHAVEEHFQRVRAAT